MIAHVVVAVRKANMIWWNKKANRRKCMDDLARRFLSPENSTHRKYEALRAHYVERLPLDEAARRFGYATGTLRNLRARFREAPEAPFFLPDRRGKRPLAPGPDRDRCIVELRTGESLSAEEIAERLTARERLAVSATTVARVLRRAGLPKLWRRTPEQRAAREPVAAADRRRLDLAPQRLRTDFGGLFVFAADLARLDLDRLLARHRLPGSSAIPAGCAVRTLLALKLWGIGRPSHVMPETLDEGLALFAGLNAVPKRSTLAHRLGNGLETANARTVFRKVVRASATIEITTSEIVVSLGRRANNPLLLNAGYADLREPIPWLANRALRLRFF